MSEKTQRTGLPVKAPDSSCNDNLCPWHGSLSLRGRVFTGTVRSAKARNTAVVEWPYTRFLTKYDRSMRQSSRVAAHNPTCIHARENDRVLIAECRPISKTKHFVVVGRVA